MSILVIRSTTVTRREINPDEIKTQEETDGRGVSLTGAPPHDDANYTRRKRHARHHRPFPGVVARRGVPGGFRGVGGGTPVSRRS